MTMFRKRPVEVEAEQFVFDADKPLASGTFVDLHGGTFEVHLDADGPYLVVPTLEGQMIARGGDWIIKGVRGELYPCKPDIFEDTYEPA